MPFRTQPVLRGSPHDGTHPPTAVPPEPVNGEGDFVALRPLAHAKEVDCDRSARLAPR